MELARRYLKVANTALQISRSIQSEGEGIRPVAETTAGLHWMRASPGVLFG